MIARVLVFALLLPGALLAADAPPRDLHLEGDHWTAWNPPASFPPGATVYTIVRGDTLWDLAARYYGDPYLWPQLWEQNRYVLDAHWIYPGDPLLIDLEVTSEDEYADVTGGFEPDLGDEGVGEGEPAADDPFRGVITADAAAGPPVPLGAESDIYCSGFIGPPDEAFPYHLIGSEHGALIPTLGGVATDGSGDYFGDIQTVRYNLSTGDVVYLDGGAAAGVRPGEVMMAVMPGEPVRHPRNRRQQVGRFYEYLARVRVLSVQEDTAIAEITEACAPVNVGALLRPFVAQPVPLGRRTRMRPINLPAADESLENAPIILLANDEIVSLGQGHLVFIDRGAGDDVLPGDIFTIYRRNKPGLPPVVVGELVVLSAEDTTALGRILESRYSIYIGDHLARK